MKNRATTFAAAVALVLVCGAAGHASAFTPASSTANARRGLSRWMNTPGARLPSPAALPGVHSSRASWPTIADVALRAAGTEEEEEEEGGGSFLSSLSDLRVNAPFAAAWVGFVSLVAARAQVEDPGFTEGLIEAFVADPVHPGGWTPLFLLVWNLLGLMPILMGSMILPRAGGQILPAGPFVLGSVAGYGVFGIFMSTWNNEASVDSVAKSDLGWFARNVLENKIFNWAALAAAVSAVWTSGAIPALLTDSSGSLREFTDLCAATSLAAGSTVDLFLFSSIAAYLIPKDLKLRGETDEDKANIVAASTLLLPVVGAFAYCALRPSLPEE